MWTPYGGPYGAIRPCDQKLPSSLWYPKVSACQPTCQPRDAQFFVGTERDVMDPFPLDPFDPIRTNDINHPKKYYNENEAIRSIPTKCCTHRYIFLTNLFIGYMGTLSIDICIKMDQNHFTGGASWPSLYSHMLASHHSRTTAHSE